MISGCAGNFRDSIFPCFYFASIKTTEKMEIKVPMNMGQLIVELSKSNVDIKPGTRPGLYLWLSLKHSATEFLLSIRVGFEWASIYLWLCGLSRLKYNTIKVYCCGIITSWNTSCVSYSCKFNRNSIRQITTTRFCCNHHATSLVCNGYI